MIPFFSARSTSIFVFEDTPLFVSLTAFMAYPLTDIAHRLSILTHALPNRTTDYRLLITAYQFTSTPKSASPPPLPPPSSPTDNFVQLKQLHQYPWPK